MPGIGFLKVGSTDAAAGMYSSDGKTVTITQGGAAISGSIASVTVGNNDVNISAWDGVSINGRSGVDITTGAGNINIAGNLAAHQRAEFTTTGWFVSGGQSWDSGPVVLDTTGNGTRTLNNDFCAVGPYAGSISFTKAGFYSISLLIIPRGNPGVGWSRLNHISGERLAQTGNSTAMWETYLTTLPVYFAAGDYVRSQMSYTADHNVDCRWKVVKHPY
jgi:hypothetical protein